MVNYYAFYYPDWDNYFVSAFNFITISIKCMQISKRKPLLIHTVRAVNIYILS